MAKVKERQVLATKLKKGDPVAIPGVGVCKALEVKIEKLFVSVWVKGTAPGQHRTVYDFHKKEMVWLR